jgi:AcrR family transcriptional regulator
VTASRARRRPGRPAGGSRSRESILRAARTSFATNGYDRTTIRAVAASARVDPALVHHYFGTKDRLFVAAMEFPIDPAVVAETVLGEGLDRAGERLVRLFLTIWETPGNREPLLGLVRSAVTNPRAARMLREFMTRALLSRIAPALGRKDAELRVALVGSQVVGLAILRYVIRVEPLASATEDELVAAVGPRFQEYLTADLAAAPGSQST